MELESALLIIPPRPVQAFAYPFREEYDPQSFAKVPAHITLLYPFVAADEVEAAAGKLAAIVGKHSAFEVTLDHYGQTKDTLFLEPADPEPLISLYASLADAYPTFALPPRTFRPHLTLARFDPGADGDQIELPAEPSFSFTVDKIHIYVGAPEDLDAPYIPRAVIPLGGQN